MSNAALDWAKDQRAGSPTRKAVLLVLADAANDAGTAWLSRRTLAEIAEVSADTLKRALRDLQAAGLVVRRPRLRANGSETSSYWDLPIPRGGATRPSPRGATRTPPGGATRTPPDPSLDPSEEPPPVGAGAPASTAGDVMTSVDPDQIGFDLGIEEEAPPAPKPRADGGPCGRIVAAYCRAYVEEHERQPASERARVAGQAKTLLGQGHEEAELVEAAEAMGRTRFTFLAEEVKRIRAKAERVDRAKVGAPEGWGGAGTDAPTSWIYG